MKRICKTYCSPKSSREGIKRIDDDDDAVPVGDVQLFGTVTS